MRRPCTAPHQSWRPRLRQNANRVPKATAAFTEAFGVPTKRARSFSPARSSIRWVRPAGGAPVLLRPRGGLIVRGFALQCCGILTSIMLSICWSFRCA